MKDKILLQHLVAEQITSGWFMVCKYSVEFSGNTSLSDCFTPDWLLLSIQHSLSDKKPKWGLNDPKFALSAYKQRYLLLILLMAYSKI